MSLSESNRSRFESEPVSTSPVRASEPNRVRLLLERGLELFGRAELEQAVRCWQRVLELVPEHPQALDYLNAAAGDEPVAASSVPVPERHGGVVDRGLLRAHLEQGNYQDAWLVLEDALRLYPEDPELLRARDLLEPRVALRIAAYMRLSMPPRIADSVPAEPADLDERQRELLRLAGTSESYAQILDRSPFGEVDTLLGLRNLEGLGLLDSSWPHPPSDSAPAEATVEVTRELDLSNVEGLKHFELLADLDELNAVPGELSARCVSVLASALRLLGSEETIVDVAALTVDEIKVVRRMSAGGPLVSVAVDRAVSQLGLARLQVQMACQRLEQE